MRKLNLGSGMNKIKGYINIDSDKSTNPDIVRNIEKGLPFDDDSVDEVRAYNILEHCEDAIFVIKEIWRVCKNGAMIFIEVPIGLTQDPTHKTFFSPDTFDIWTNREEGGSWQQDYYGGCIKFKEIKKEIWNSNLNKTYFFLHKVTGEKYPILLWQVLRITLEVEK